MVRRSSLAKGRSKRGRRVAATSDRYELYERSVQEPEAECDLIDQAWKERRGRVAHHVREDFCGTAAVAMEWVKRRRTNTAVGVDRDSSVLDWARTRIPDRLSPSQARRLTLVQGDVRRVRIRNVDSVLAMNFSYWIFRSRIELRRYFRAVNRSLVSDGLFLLDAYGGGDSFMELQEKQRFDGFTYIWDQHSYNPITGEVVNHIHYSFPDGSRIRKAFTYHWRLWTLPELQEILLEAGFRDVVVYWEGTDKKTGEGDGIWKVSTRGEACPGWIAYLVAEK